MTLLLEDDLSLFENAFLGLVRWLTVCKGPCPARLVTWVWSPRKDLPPSLSFLCMCFCLRGAGVAICMCTTIFFPWINWLSSVVEHFLSILVGREMIVDVYSLPWDISRHHCEDRCLLGHLQTGRSGWHDRAGLGLGWGRKVFVLFGSSFCNQQGFPLPGESRGSEGSLTLQGCTGVLLGQGCEPSQLPAVDRSHSLLGHPQ